MAWIEFRPSAFPRALDLVRFEIEGCRHHRHRMHGLAVETRTAIQSRSVATYVSRSWAELESDRAVAERCQDIDPNAVGIGAIPVTHSPPPRESTARV